MSLLDDVLGFFRDALFGNTREADRRREMTDDKATVGARLMSGALDGLRVGADAAFGRGTGDSIGRLAGALRDHVTGTQSLESTIYDWVLSDVKRLAAVPLVERRAPSGGGAAATAEGELQAFEQAANEAILGASAASGAIMLLNVAAATADAALQGATLGQARLFQELVQNTVWSLGLSDLGGLAFRPQIAASFAPLLERHYNRLAQAQIPGSGDLIRFLVREVLDPTRRAALEADKTPETLREFMRQRGFSDFWTDSYWAAHWNLLSATQLNEAVHRGYISEEEWERQTRLNDVVPEGIPWLKQTIYAPYTRVDARRMADLGLLADDDLLQAYADIGYYAPKTQDASGRWRAQFVARNAFDATVHTAQGLVVFTRIFNAMPDIRRRLSNGFLKPEAVEGEIRALGVPDATARRLTETLVKAVDLGEAAEIRNLTTAQVVRGAKNGLISFEQGQFLLEQLGWSAARAEFMLRLQVSPEEAPTATDLGRRLTRGE